MLDYDDFVSNLPCDEPSTVTDTLRKLSGDTQKLAKAWKFHDQYHQPLDMDRLMRIMGDVEFQLAVLRSLLLPMGGLTREQILAASIEKLGAE